MSAVTLRPMTAQMYHAYYKEYQNDPDLFIDKSKCAPYVYVPEGVDRYIQRQIDLNRKCFAILLGDEIAGEIIIKNIEPRRCATLSISMKNAAYKDRGIGTQAERLAIDYVFRELDIPILYADTILTNTRSQHVLEKVGFRYLRTEGDFKYYCIERVPQWIFFDLGSTLIDETAADLRRIREMTAGTGVTVGQYRQKRQELLGQGLPGDAAAAAFFGLTKTPWHSEEETPYPDAAPTLAVLKERGYRLGVIANQQPGSAERLANRGLLGYFDAVVASAEAGVAKPDPAIFRMALEQAGCEPAQAVMVGDRLDNDVAPANRLGIRTVRILRGPCADQRPQTPDEQPEYTINALEKLPTLFPLKERV